MWHCLRTRHQEQCQGLGIPWAHPCAITSAASKPKNRRGKKKESQRNVCSGIFGLNRFCSRVGSGSWGGGTEGRQEPGCQSRLFMQQKDVICPQKSYPRLLFHCLFSRGVTAALEGLGGAGSVGRDGQLLMKGWGSWGGFSVKIWMNTRFWSPDTSAPAPGPDPTAKALLPPHIRLLQHPGGPLASALELGLPRPFCCLINNVAA